MVSFEKYRKSYFCPIPGCCSSKPIKKISNHLASVHRLSTKEWLQHLAKARRSQLDPLPKGQSTLSLKKQYIVQPKGKPKEGWTRSFPNYSPDTPELVKFCENLTGFDSGHKSLPDTRQICSDIGKFFAHVYKAKIRWIRFFNKDNLKSFVDKLLNSKIGTDGIMSKLKRLMIAINYTLREHKLSSSEYLFCVNTGRASSSIASVPLISTTVAGLHTHAATLPFFTPAIPQKTTQGHCLTLPPPGPGQSDWKNQTRSLRGPSRPNAGQRCPI